MPRHSSECFIFVTIACEFASPGLYRMATVLVFGKVAMISLLCASVSIRSVVPQTFDPGKTTPKDSGSLTAAIKIGFRFSTLAAA
jgi:hypothetical protein